MDILIDDFFTVMDAKVADCDFGTSAQVYKKSNALAILEQKTK